MLKNILLALVLLLGIIYSSPNLFGEDPSVQISSANQVVIDQTMIPSVEQILSNNKIDYKNLKIEGDNLLIRFRDADTQLKARDAIKNTLGENYIVALNLASRTPKWLTFVGANPMKLGLDLRGGVHLLYDVDTKALLKAREDGDLHSVGDALRNADIRYAGIMPREPHGFIVHFRDEKSLDDAFTEVGKRYPDYLLTKNVSGGDYALEAGLNENAVLKVVQYAVDQTMTTLRNRVSELGVSEAIVQSQGQDHISVDLPGIQDSARAKDIIGKTATLKFLMVDTDHDLASALAGDVPIGSRLYEYEGRPVLLKEQVILQGSSITYATASYSQDGRSAVEVRLGGGGESMFNRVTAANIGKPMAVVYVETKSDEKMVDGKKVVSSHQEQKVISVATIQSALGMSFEITGLQSEKYAENLALLLRSGALFVPVNIIEELTIGPSMGKANIDKGVMSVVVGFVAVVLFMALYYGLFGIIADMALFLNLIFIVAILSILGSTLTLPGIAGIVLTVGMSVDANVLIYERIREELRNGASPHASINAGYSRALVTIIDANVTTLIVALILFALGSGPVKNFAIVLTIGLMTSMVTAIVFTRAVVELIYGGKSVKTLAIGMRKQHS